MVSTTPATTGSTRPTPASTATTTGTGNTLNVRHPRRLQLMMDSLRYWVLEMHVDGFRFDLAASLARQFHEVDRLSAFFDLIQQDPVISQVKLIAEPWDVGAGGYQVGELPRAVVGMERQVPGQRARLLAPARHVDRRPGPPPDRQLGPLRGHRPAPFASVNFVTAHDGFTLADLVSYNTKHNEANGEDNRDGTDDNRSWNCGVEGPTDDPAIWSAAQAPGPRTSWPPCVLSPGRPHAARRGRAGPDAAGQQQRLLPGQRDLLVRLGQRRHRPAGLVTLPAGPAPGPPGLPAAAFLPGPAPAPAGHRPRLGRHRLVPARRPAR